jgi:hypothetical protein
MLAAICRGQQFHRRWAATTLTVVIPALLVIAAERGGHDVR